MNLKMIKNPNEKIYNDVTEAVIENDNYCPCKVEKTIETKCPCKEFREQATEGLCHCERFLKVKTEDDKPAPRIAKFQKVTYEQFKMDWLKIFKNRKEESDKEYVENIIKKNYANIKLPERATKYSAGYDFYIPFDYTLKPNESVMIPTGIRCKMNENYALQIYPRSSYGVKYGLHLANTVGIIDSDYYYSDNEGHIYVKLTNDGLSAQDVILTQGTAFCQGVFMQYGITFDDEVSAVRNGGFGSTNKK